MSNVTFNAQDLVTIRHACNIAIMSERDFIEAHHRHGEPLKGAEVIIESTRQRIKRFEAIIKKICAKPKTKEPPHDN